VVWAVSGVRGGRREEETMSVQPDLVVVAVETVDHADGTYSVVVTYAGEEALGVAPPDGRQRFDFGSAAERDAAAAEWQEKVTSPRGRGRRAEG
jgi:hypothetical protein